LPSKYELDDDYIKICEEPRKKGRARIVELTGIEL
jgi:hypothetical protein